MDIPRNPARKRAPFAAAVAILTVVGLITLGLGRLKAASPSVDRASIWVGTVKRGPMLRQVKGPGTLAPEEIRWITAETAGRVEHIALRPPGAVAEDTLLVELTNPDVMLEALTADREVASAESDLLQLRSRLRSEELAERASVLSLASDLADAQRRAAAYRAGAGEVFTDLDTRRAGDRSAELSGRLALAQQRVTVVEESLRDELGAQRIQIARRKNEAEFRRRRVAAMRVRAGGAGVLQDLPLELGQWVVPGTLLAKVIRPERLKAVLRIAEIQAKDVALGQRAEIDTRNGVIPGKVARIAPAASQGTVTVEVALEDPLPAGALPDLTVDGTIELERLGEVLYVDRPAGAQPEAPFGLFKLAADGASAARTTADLGRTSVTTIEVRRGLNEGDRVILSDMSRWDAEGRVTIQ
jgi:hypothetical protein